MTARRILVRLPNWLGDLLMSRPLLVALRTTLREAHIHAMGTPAASLIRREGLWDAWTGWPIDPEDAFFLARQSFDASVVLPPSFSSAWWLRPLRIPCRIGFATGGRSWLLSHALKRPDRGEMHLSEEYLRLGEPLGVLRASVPLLRAAPDELEAAGARLRRMELVDRPHVVFGPGAAYGPAKRWPSERFVTLGRRFTERGLAVLVCGAAEDRSLAQAMASEMGPGAQSVAGQTSLEEQLALCATARVTVSNDSGLAHLAAASGAPTVVIFGSTSSAWTAPLGPRVVVVQRAPVCSPCFRRTCGIGYRCLAAITVDEVDRACRRIAA